MEIESVPFASQGYWLLFALLAFGRGMDFLSTWVATPRMVLEANPLAARMGWRWGTLFNLALAAGFARWPMPAIIVTTTSFLVAAHNFRIAWQARLMGEHAYSCMHVEYIEQVPLPLYLVCLAGQTVLVGLVGGAVLYYGQNDLMLASIGIGIISFAGAVGFYSLLSLWRIRRGAWRAPKGPGIED